MKTWLGTIEGKNFIFLGTDCYFLYLNINYVTSQKAIFLFGGSNVINEIEVSDDKLFSVIAYAHPCEC